VQMTGVALVLGSGPEPGDTPPLVVGVEGQVQPDRVVDATDEADAGARLFLRDCFSGLFLSDVL